MKILKFDEITLQGKYLVEKNSKTPINNKAFVRAQKEAEKLESIVAAAKELNFTPNIPKYVTFDEVLALGMNKLNRKHEVEIFKAEKPELGEINNKLKEEALAWDKKMKAYENTQELNKIIQNFIPVQDCEESGIPFESGICTLNKIYDFDTIKKLIVELDNIVKGNETTV